MILGHSGYSPGIIMHGTMNCPTTDVVSKMQGSHRFAIQMTAQDFLGLSGGKFCLPLTVAGPSPLCYGVSHIIAWRPKEEMTRIHTGGIITAVANDYAFGNRPMKPGHNKAGSGHVSAVLCGQPYQRITATPVAREKRPAAIGVICIGDVCPKRGVKAGDCKTLGTSRGAKNVLMSGDSRGPFSEFAVALVAQQPYFHACLLKGKAPQSGRFLLREPTGPWGHNEKRARRCAFPQHKQYSTDGVSAQQAVPA